MINLKEFQKQVYNLKKEKGFNTTDVNLEFCFLQKEVTEAFEAYHKKLPDLGEELADVFIFLCGLAEMLDFDLEKEVSEKYEKNKKREYEKINGANIKIKDD